jgi:uncharacterized membrane protein YedE/YeeE
MTRATDEIVDVGCGEQVASDWRAGPLWPLFLLGIYLGFVFTKAQVISWFRIQEMFRFQSFHMYGIIGSAVAVAAVGVRVVKALGLHTVSGTPIEIPAPTTRGVGVRHVAGGVVFGLGWALTGACPGPMFALVGNGVTAMLAAIASAVAGVWAYALLRPRLPH